MLRLVAMSMRVFVSAFALGLCQLLKLNGWLERRRQIWQRSDELFAATALAIFQTPTESGKRTVSIPLSPHLKDEEVERIAEAVRDVLLRKTLQLSR